MPFKKPDIAKLMQLAEHLEAKYKGTNSLRFSVIYLLKQATGKAKKLSPEKAHDLLMSIVTSVLESIRCHEYASSWRSARNSDLYKFIEDFLNINDANPFSSYERLPYLYQAQMYAQVVYNDIDLADLQATMTAVNKTKHNSSIKCAWENKAGLQKFIDTSISAHLYYFRKNLAAQEESTKELAALRRDTQEIPEEYEKQIAEKNKHKWIGTAEERPHIANIIRFLYKACLRLYIPNYENESDDSAEKEELAHMGLHYYLMNSIEDASWLSPKRGYLGWHSGSSMFQIVEKKFGKNFHKFSVEDKLQLIDGLIELLKRIKNATRFFKEQKEFWAAQKFGNLEEIFQKFSNEVHTYRLKIEKSKDQASVSGMVVSASAGYAIQAVAKQGVENGFKAIASTAMLTGFGISASNPVSLAISTAAAILFLSVSYVARKTVAGRVVVGLMQSGVDVVTGAAGDKAADTLSNLFSTREKLDSLRKTFKPEEDEIYCAWINTLLKLNEKFVPEARKANLRAGLGLAPGEALKPRVQLAANRFTTFKLEIKEEEYDPSQAKQAAFDAKYEKEEVAFRQQQEEQHGMFAMPSRP